ncbi:hypothetical protein EJB05_45809, partial [Eragrostis curvula]
MFQCSFPIAVLRATTMSVSSSESSITRSSKCKQGKIAAYHDIWPPISALMLLLLVRNKYLKLPIKWCRKHQQLESTSDYPTYLSCHPIVMCVLANYSSLHVLYKNLIWVFIFVDAICKVERQAVRMNDVLLVVRHAQHLNLLLIRL